MAKIGRKVVKGKCQCERRGVVFESRRYKDGQGEYILCPNCKMRHRRRK
jgi:hypothetical protein